MVIASASASVKRSIGAGASVKLLPDVLESEALATYKVAAKVARNTEKRIILRLVSRLGMIFEILLYCFAAQSDLNLISIFI